MRRDIFFSGLRGSYYSEHILLAYGYFRVYAQALSHLLFHSHLSVGGEDRGLTNPSCLPQELGKARQHQWPDRPEQDLAHLLALEGRSRCGEQSGLLFRTETCLL